MPPDSEEEEPESIRQTFRDALSSPLYLTISLGVFTGMCYFEGVRVLARMVGEIVVWVLD